MLITTVRYYADKVIESTGRNENNITKEIIVKRNKRRNQIMKKTVVAIFRRLDCERCKRLGSF